MKILPNIKPRDQNPNRDGYDDNEPALPPEKCQHIKIVDCDQPVQRVFYECYNCRQGLISECTGKPLLEEYKGRLQEQQIPVRCPTCFKTAIRLITGEVLSTTAIPSPWGD
ncbi:MAG: hypothetical protein DSM106950_18340 [Stigonema ocellatum SAG 48.90 = DSM 106950]|nr:hypothetical protein [Stigonema ocellatum SAG 48.90 = DSM 106950]